MKSYYEILDVPETATQDEIKATFRKLVRKYHPDVHPDKHLAEMMFKQINEAYQTLSDPGRRAMYDAECSAAKRRAAGSARPGPASPMRPRTGSTQPRPSIEKLIRDAEFAFIRGRMGEAEALCRDIIRKHRSNARAYTILGDIYQAKGLKEIALEHYTYAVQFDPNNRDIQAKLNRLLGIDARSSGSVRQQSTKETPSIGTLTANLFGWVGFLMMLWFWIPHISGPRLAVGHASTALVLQGWNVEISLALAAEGLLLGALLRSGRFFGHYDDELVFQSIRHGAGRAPIGLLLIGLSCVFFWLTMAVYLLMSTFQENVSRSLSRAFIVTVVLVVAAAGHNSLNGSSLGLGILAIGGNFIFVSMLLGWWMTDVFRETLVRELDVR
ncbi:MAG: DnaJ domain-containing protein [Armatimonadota bacterium]